MAILRTMAERLRETNAMLSERAAKNAVEEIEKHLTWQDKLADTVAEFNGSWGFILLLVGLTGAVVRHQHPGPARQGAARRLPLPVLQPGPGRCSSPSRARSS